LSAILAPEPRRRTAALALAGLGAALLHAAALHGAQWRDRHGPPPAAPLPVVLRLLEAPAPEVKAEQQVQRTVRSADVAERGRARERALRAAMAPAAAPAVPATADIDLPGAPADADAFVHNEELSLLPRWSARFSVPALDAGDAAPIEVAAEIYVDEAGRIVGLRLRDAPGTSEQLSRLGAALSQGRFAPGEMDGMAVRSRLDALIVVDRGVAVVRPLAARGGDHRAARSR
jgi:hypothetical protein